MDPGVYNPLLIHIRDFLRKRSPSGLWVDVQAERDNVRRALLELVVGLCVDLWVGAARFRA